MGIFDALTTAVAGLQAQSFALQNISGNIANSETTGYKETDSSFEDMVSAAVQNQQTTDGVIANSVATNTVQGTIQSTSVSTDMAINGSGYFVVAKPDGNSGNQPVFSGVNYYTRAGDFQMNDNGYLVNGAGYYLEGIPINPATGTTSGSSPQVLQFNNNFVPASATTTINYQANLPSSPSSGQLIPADFESNPLAGAPVAASVTGTGATLSPDKLATGTGTIGAMSSSTTLSSLGVSAGQTITVSDGTNTTSYTSTGTDTVGDLMSAINGGSATVTASLNGSGDLVLAGNNFTSSVTVGGTAASAIGFGAGQNSFSPTNLLTQSAVSQGQTLTVSVAGGTPQTITFGTGTGQVSTLAQLQTAIQGLSGVNGSVNTANGDITLTAVNPTANLAVGGTAAASKFGIQATTALPANSTVIANDQSTFTSQSVDGGSITAYDSEGNAVDVQFRWAQTADNTWQLFYQNNTTATGTQAAWQNVGTSFTFNANGQMTPPISSVALNNLTVNGDSLGAVQLNFGANGLTQFANASGTTQVSQLQQNGFAAGQLQSISVDNNNQVTGVFSNGQTIALAQITLASFNGADSLQALNGDAFAATTDSGQPIYGATGKVVGSSLESSNVDISTQFSSLIVAQQAYSANARVMSTADQMIQSLLQVIQ
ncbi:MAG TPA: flagellar hook-basal body complex protein [Xanthobacteraceae bacterium]|jgi:flagellar hook protein FlgE|nr:flagellar hook-basal body complex protein [Xanthobacteraceae bacterium]